MNVGLFSEADARKIARYMNQNGRRNQAPRNRRDNPRPTAKAFQHGIVNTASEIPEATGSIPGALAGQVVYFFNGGLVDSGFTATIYNTSDEALPAGLYTVHKISGAWFVDTRGSSGGGTSTQHTFVFLADLMNRATNNAGTITPTTLDDQQIYTFSGADIADSGVERTIYNYNTECDVFPGLHRIDIIGGKYCVDPNTVYDLFIEVADGGIDAATRDEGPPVAYTPGLASGHKVFARTPSGRLEWINGLTLDVYNYQQSAITKPKSLVPIAYMQGIWFARPSGTPNRVRVQIKDFTVGQFPFTGTELCTVLGYTGSDPGVEIDVANPYNLGGWMGWAEYSETDEQWQVVEGLSCIYFKVPASPGYIDDRDGATLGKETNCKAVVKNGDDLQLTNRQVTIHNLSVARVVQNSERIGVAAWTIDHWTTVAMDAADFSGNEHVTQGFDV